MDKREEVALPETLGAQMIRWLDESMTRHGLPTVPVSVAFPMASVIDQRVQAAVAPLEMELRQMMWRGHGHVGIYGDDGEMQCFQCTKLGGVWDYLRAPLADVRKAYFVAQAERASKPSAESALRDMERQRDELRGKIERLINWWGGAADPCMSRKVVLDVLHDLLAASPPVEGGEGKS